MLWSFRGRISRLPYALLASGLFFSQHVVTWAIFKLRGEFFAVGWTYLILPLRALVTDISLPSQALLVVLAYALVVSWALAALTFRRANDAGEFPMAAALALAPVVQLVVIAVMSSIPPATLRSEDERRDLVQATKWQHAVTAVVSGALLTTLAVAVGALIFGSYGYGVFVVTPFAIGAIAAYLANRHGDIGAKATRRMALMATLAGGLALVSSALEGVICIVMAAPLAAGLAILGGMFGREMAGQSAARPGQTLGSVALLPLVFVGEMLLPPSAGFDATERIEIAAAPAAVWASLLDLDMTREPVTLPYRLGLAHPKRGTVVGEGVGALRYGEFSTGTAVERVTTWQPARRLTFAVVKDVPAMHELSPYQHVHAPHAVGYFNTETADFALRALPSGGTEVVLTTAHTLKLEPVFYWLPLARFAVHGNNRRVLAHVKRAAEVAGARRVVRNEVSTP